MPADEPEMPAPRLAGNSTAAGAKRLPQEGGTVRAGCPGCRSPLKLKRYFAGRRVRCPWCGQVFRAPPAEAKAGSLRSRLLAEVRQMRARDQGSVAPLKANGPLGSGYQVAADDAQTRQANGLPAANKDKPKELLPGPEEAWQPLPEEQELAQNGPTRRRSTKVGRGDYARVQTGMTVNLVAAALLLLVFSLVLIAILCSSKTLYECTDPLNYATYTPDPNAHHPVTIFFAGLAAVSEIIHIVGLIYCLGAPRKDSAQTMAFVALLTSAAGLTFVCTAGALGLAGKSGAGVIALLIVGIILLLAAKSLHLLFLRALGLAMEVLWLARQVYGTIALFMAAAFFHLIVLTGAGFGLTRDIAGVVTGMGSGEGLKELGPALFFWGGSLLILLYALIRNVITLNDARNEVVYHLMGRKG